MTATSVSELSAAASWNMPELQTSPPASRNAFRLTGAAIGTLTGEHTPEACRELQCAAVRRVPDIRRVEDGRGDPPDGDDAAAAGQLVEERSRCAHLTARRPPVRISRPRVRRDDVPQKHIVLEAELAEDAMHDRRARLGRARAGQLTLGRERHTADARAAIAGSLADEDDGRRGALLEIDAESFAPERRARVLIVRRADARAGEPIDEIHAAQAGDVERARQSLFSSSCA